MLTLSITARTDYFTQIKILHQPDKHVNFILTTFFPSCWILLLAIILDGFHSQSHHHSSLLLFENSPHFRFYFMNDFRCFVSLTIQLLYHSSNFDSSISISFCHLCDDFSHFRLLPAHAHTDFFYISFHFFCSHFFHAFFAAKTILKIFLSYFIIEIFSAQQKEPFFESNQNLNVTVLENESVVLKCAVRHKGNKTVSIKWQKKSFKMCTLAHLKCCGLNYFKALLTLMLWVTLWKKNLLLLMDMSHTHCVSNLKNSNNSSTRLWVIYDKAFTQMAHCILRNYQISAHSFNSKFQLESLCYFWSIHKKKSFSCLGCVH